MNVFLTICPITPHAYIHTHTHTYARTNIHVPTHKHTRTSFMRYQGVVMVELDPSVLFQEYLGLYCERY